MKEKKQAIRTVLALIIFTVLFIYFVYHAYLIVGFFSRIISLIFPFILGCAIAFVINIPMRGIENTFFKNPQSRLYKAKRGISMVLAYVFALLVIALVMFVVVPDLAETVQTMRNEDFIGKAKAELLKYTERFPDIAKQIRNFEIDYDALGNLFKSNGSTILTTTVSIFSSIIGVVVNVVIGFVFSLYILSQKEKLGKQVKMLLYAFCKENVADEFMVFGKIANTTFSKFFTCQFREGIIIGAMFALGMTLFRMPYALTIGVLIGFTALIPVFGAFLGLFIGCFMILVVSPKIVIWFVVLFFVLQFIENNFIYPKLVGDDVGLSAIWVLLAVIVGGDLMGVVGMFVFIPLVSVLYAYFRSIVYRRLKKRQIDVEEKEAPDDVVPLMESRRRLFMRRAKELREAKKKKNAENTENEEAAKTAEADIDETDNTADDADGENKEAQESKIKKS